MTDVQLLEQYEDAKRLFVRKQCHIQDSIGEVDTQYEAIRRIGTASSVLDIGCGSGDEKCQRSPRRDAHGNERRGNGHGCGGADVNRDADRHHGEDGSRGSGCRGAHDAELRR